MANKVFWAQALESKVVAIGVLSDWFDENVGLVPVEVSCAVANEISSLEKRMEDIKKIIDKHEKK